MSKKLSILTVGILIFFFGLNLFANEKIAFIIINNNTVYI